MQKVHDDFLEVLRAQDVNRSRSMTVLYEIYQPNYVVGSGANSTFDPLDALERFAGVAYSLQWQGQTVVYRREVIGHVRWKKTISKQLNNVSVTVSNVSRHLSQFVLTNEVQGMWLVIRAVDRTVPDPISDGKSGVVFVGRCEKPDGFDRKRGTISAKPHLGNINVQIPSRRIEPLCPLDFKGEECMGTETLDQKTLAYRQAARCNKTEAQCIEYGNEKMRQGIKLVQIKSSFEHRPHQGLLKKILNALPGISRPRNTVSNSTTSDSEMGDVIPLVFGRWLKVLKALQYQDQGEAIWFKAAAGRGPISDFIFIRTSSDAFEGPHGVQKHLGEYGGQGTQTEDNSLGSGERWLSRLAYISGYYLGTKIEEEDPVPETESLVAGVIPDNIYFDVDPDGTGKLKVGTGGVTAGGTSGTSEAAEIELVGATLSDQDPGDIAIKPSGTTAGDVMIAAVEDFGAFNVLVPDGWNGPIASGTADSGPESSDLTLNIYWKVAGLDEPDTELWDNAFWVWVVSYRGVDVVNPIHAVSDAGIIELDATNELMVPAVTTSVDGCRLLVLANSATGMGITALTPAGFAELIDLFGHWAYDRAQGAAGDSGDVTIEVIDPVTAIGFQLALKPAGGSAVPDWTDNPVDHARFIFTDPALLANPDSYVDDYLSAYAAAYNCGAIKDETNAERCLLPNDQDPENGGEAGIAYKRFNSTGLLGPASFDPSRTQRPAGVPDRQALIEYFDPDDPPTSLDAVTVHRKRFTANLEIAETEKILDFLYDVLHPTHRGFLRWNTKGQVVFDNLRPADHTWLRLPTAVDAEQIAVLDATHWKNRLGSEWLLEGKILLGVGLLTSEVRVVASAEWSADGDGIDISATNASASGANLAGGSPTVQSSAEVQLAAISEGTEVTITVDGVDCTMVCAAGETLETAGHRMACCVNADPVLREYVEAHADDAGLVTVYSKYGVLVLERPLEEEHRLELADPEDPPAAAPNVAGTMDAGIYLVAYSYRNANGQTKISPIVSVTLADNESLDLALPAALPAEADSAEWYVSRAPNGTDLGLVASNDGAAFNVDELPEGESALPPALNTTGEEVLRVMGSYAGEALSYADTTRANILDGTFEWPEGGSRSEINKLNGTYLEAIQDFAEQPLTVNDRVHQARVKDEIAEDVDLRMVDNFNTAARLLNGEINTIRGGDMFFKWGSAGEALLHDEGDVVCVSDRSGGHDGFRNVPVRLRDVESDKLPEVTLRGRIYAHNHYGDLIAVLSDGDTGAEGSVAPLVLPSSFPGLGSPPPPPSFDEENYPPDGLAQATIGTVGVTTVTGGFLFGTTPYGQRVKVRLILRAGVVVDVLLSEQIQASGVDGGAFEFVAIEEGIYIVELEACNQWGCNATRPTAKVVIVYGSLFAICAENGAPILNEGGEFIEREH